jgi:ribulose-phosphate 3-epimerase
LSLRPLLDIARDDERAARDQRRISNRLRADLLAVFPAAIDIAAGDLNAPVFLKLLERWPSADALAQASPGELEAFARAGSDIITVHAEAGPHVHRSLQAIRALGKKAGVAINPGTPESAVEPLLDDVDLILIMSVNPGFGGQKFIPAMLDKIRAAKSLIGDRPIELEVDGGITIATAGSAIAAGANVLVAGSAIFKGDGVEDYRTMVSAVRAAAEQGRA